MSLVTKMVASAVVPVALVLVASGAGIFSLVGAGDASRQSLARLAPVVSEAAAAHESLSALNRLHARSVAVGGSAYEVAWISRMEALKRRLVVLEDMLVTAPERRHALKARRAIARYRDLVATDRGLRQLSVAAFERATAANFRARRAVGEIAPAVRETAREAEREARATALQARNALLAVAAIAALLALLASSWMGRRIAVGLARLTSASAALERGRLDQPVAIGGRDELGQLAAAFEALAAGLGERDRIAEDTIRRLGRDIVGPLRAICDTSRALTSEVTALPLREQTLVLLIGEAASDLLRQADRIGDDPTRPDAPPALAAQDVPALPAPRPLPALISVEKRS